MTSLSDAAHQVADQYREGRWPELKGLKWEKVWEFLVRELERQCPGFSAKEYGTALDSGFFETR